MKTWLGRVGLAAFIAHVAGHTQASAAAQTIARVWNEQALAAIRIDSPHPPVQARNLFHVSVAMYDAWAAYDEVGTGYVFRGKSVTTNAAAARREAISYAAYRILRERYALSRSAAKTLANLDAQMASLGYEAGNTSTNPATPAGLGNLVAATVSSSFLHDGARQTDKYLDLPPSKGGYGSKNPALVVALSGAIVVDVNRWQPLAIENALDQNGFPVGPVQSFLGSQCLGVRPFALTRQESRFFRNRCVHLREFFRGPAARPHWQLDATVALKCFQSLRQRNEKHTTQSLPHIRLKAWAVAPLRAAALAQKRIDLINLRAGQSASLLRHRKADELFASLVRETQQVFSR